MIRRLPLVASVLAVATAAGTAAAQSGGTAPAPGQPPVRADNPCLDERAERLRCPDLVIWRPYGLYYRRVGRQLRLHAGNSIVNQGTGPLEVKGRRLGPRSMTVTQRIRARAGGVRNYPSPGHLAFKFIPGQGSYWKFRNAARFEIWSLDSENRLARRVRLGPKLIYCLRDLNKRFHNRWSPRSRHFPGCSQDANLRTRVLGTSVGWSDDYPASYHEQWIDVAGLRGRFAFFHVVDPLDHLHESNERNNRSPIVYLRLPPSSFGGGPGTRYLRGADS
jgi:hypothetical protein